MKSVVAGMCTAIIMWVLEDLNILNTSCNGVESRIRFIIFPWKDRTALTSISSSGSIRMRSLVKRIPTTFCRVLSYTGIRVYPDLYTSRRFSKLSRTDFSSMNTFSIEVITSVTCLSL